ncbi:SRPBCC family protein [Deinococcus piscis]|nr:SRPBCC family protein [Deinococcus piscis]
MFKLFRKPRSESPVPEAEGVSHATLKARPEVRRSGDAAAAPARTERPQPRAGQPEPIVMRHTVPMRARPEVLYRLALVPTRRAAWDSNMAESAWSDDTQTLRNGAHARFRLVRRLGGLRFEAEYGGLKTSRSGGWRTVRGMGPLEEFSQDWTFKAVPGQPVTEVTLTLRGQVRFDWVRAQVERMMQNMLLTTLLDMQREVDAPTAGRIDKMNEDLRQQEEARRKAEKAARKGKWNRR